MILKPRPPLYHTPTTTGRILFMKKSKLIISILLVIVLFTISGCSRLVEKKDISTAEAYIKNKYGSNYQIVDYSPKKNRASGLSPARVTVRQNGIDYYVDVSDGQVVEDNYSELYAGNIVYYHILDCMSANGTKPDLSNRDIKINAKFSTIESRESLFMVQTDCSAVRDFDELIQTVDSAGAEYAVYFIFDIYDVSGADSEEWLYDFYLTCQEELESYAIHVNIRNSVNDDVIERADFGEAPYLNGETLTEDEFFAAFK